MSSSVVDKAAQAAEPAPQKPRGPRHSKDIAPDIPWLDNLITATFIGSVVVLLVTYWHKDKGMIALTAGSMALSVGMIYAVKRVARFIGPLIDFNNQLRKPTNMHKFCDQAWQLWIHLLMTVSVYFLIRDYPWFEDPYFCFANPVIDDYYDGFTKFIYAQALGIWIYTAISHRWIEKKRKDYFVMYIHHVVTIVLLSLSYRYSQARVGILIAFIHDASDITVDLLKLINYLQWEGPKFLFCVETIFAVNLGSWVYFRFWWFYQVIAVAVRAVPAMDDFRTANTPFNVFLIGLLMVLFLMHIWWFFLFLRLLWRIITDGAHTAGQHEYEGISGSEAEEADFDSKKKNQ